jgi:hypothetical protein
MLMFRGAQLDDYQNCSVGRGAVFLGIPVIQKMTLAKKQLHVCEHAGHFGVARIDGVAGGGH